MKRLGLIGVYEWGLHAVLFLIVLHAPIVVGLGSLLPDFATPIKAWKEFALMALAILAVIIATRRGLWQQLSKSRLLQLCLGFIVLHLVLALALGGEVNSIAAGLIIDLRFIGMFMLMYLLAIMQPKATARMLGVVAAGAGVVLGFGLLQITVLPDDLLTSIGYSRQTITPYTTIDSNPDYVRINSTLRGPNPLGALAVVYGTLVLAYLVRRHATASVRTKLILGAGFIASVAVLFASYSRSAYIAFIASTGVVAASSLRLTKRLVGIIASIVVVSGLALILVSTTDWYTNVILHEDDESITTSKSNDEHVQSLATGAYRAVTQPVGAGIGSTGSASLYDKDSANDAIIENYYFFVAHESGWLGLITFVALYVLIMISLWKRRANWPALAVFASGIGLALIGLLLPVWADETVSLIWWAMAGALVAPKRYNK